MSDRVTATLLDLSKPKSKVMRGVEIATVAALIPAFGIGFVLGVYYLEAFQQSRLLKDIFKEVAKFNEVVENLEILDKLKKAGNTIDITDRHKVIKVIETMGEDLRRALKTEKILRDNPQFKPESFDIDLTTLRALQVSNQASEYGKLFDDAIKVAIDVQETMRGLTSS